MNPRERGRFDPVWLFPVTYALHLSEEYFIAGGFPLWMQRVLGLELTNTEFVAWNIFALVLMVLGAWLVAAGPQFRFIEIAIAIGVLGNVAAHGLGSLITWSYSPGLITGVTAWIPLGVIRLRSARRASTRRASRAGTYIGLSVVLITCAVIAFASTY